MEREAQAQALLTAEVISNLRSLHLQFASRRCELLQARRQRQKEFDAGELPEFLRDHPAHQESWKVAAIPQELCERRVEITGPANNRKMVIQMLNPGPDGIPADMAMLDFEDSMMPSFSNVLDAIENVRGVALGDLEFKSAEKTYALHQGKRAYPMVRVRGLHLDEVHLNMGDGEALSASVFDLYMVAANTAQIYLRQGKTPKFYVPKCEHYLEARWWNDLFAAVESKLGIARGSLRATFLIETLPAAFQMEEILYEIRERACGLNGGRWDKIFSDIKVLGNHARFIAPDRSTIDMSRPWMDHYAHRLIKICHRHGAFAMGGMSAFTPGKEPALRQQQTQKVTADKARENRIGHDGCWVSHPYFIKIARDQFPHKNQLGRMLEDFDEFSSLLPEATGPITEKGLRTNIRVGIAYVKGWNEELGCVAFDNLMEDLATLEISRAQTWQWLHHGVQLEGGLGVDANLIRKFFDEECLRIQSEMQSNATDIKLWQAAKATACEVFLQKELAPFFSDALKILSLSKTVSTNPSPQRRSLMSEASVLSNEWKNSDRWNGIQRKFSAEDVLKLRGSFRTEYTLATMGARRLWGLLQQNGPVRALGALTGNQAVQQVRGGLEAIYLSGWQVAADANSSGNMYPDQSLYPVDSVPEVVRRVNRALQRADQIQHSEGKGNIDWMAPIVADAEAGFGGPLNAFELMKGMIEAGASGVHFEDQLASEKKCGHLGGKVLVPTSQFIRTLTAARLAADVMGVPTVLVARTDADSAQLLTSDVDEYDHPMIKNRNERTAEGFFHVKDGLEAAIARGLAYAPFADLIWCETSTPDLQQAKQFSEAIRQEFPGKMLAYNCSPSFNWRKNLDDRTIKKFQNELNAMGYKFQFVTLAGFHALNYSMFLLSREYRIRGMSAYADLQDREFAIEKFGYTATKHQREVGTGYFDQVSRVISGGAASTLAMHGSTEEAQFKDADRTESQQPGHGISDLNEDEPYSGVW